MEPGKMLAHYRVEEKIGAGGMGEVYRAHDTTLGRDVALKLLPAEFAVDGERLARFQREAKMLASLHHPNIASIFGFETVDGHTFLTMELVEGEDLSEVIKRGAVSIEDAVDIARQIAEGLEEAHEKGIVHRDLKPANVKRTPEGKVKVLDFGLARAFAGQTAVEDEIGSAATMTAGMTQAGTVLGTAAYMSPEQARGKEVDRRADIWAFGVILFEMLTGRQLFAGETATDTLAGILKTEPDWNSLPANLPPQVERVLRRCLSKDPRQRLRDIGEARVRLEDPTAESGLFTGSFATMPDEARRRGLPAAVPWAVAAVCVAGVAWVLLTGGFGRTERPMWHLGFQAPLGREFHIAGSTPALPQISPDGRMVVFGAIDRETRDVSLYVRSLDSGKSVRLDGTGGAEYPFWSPDSEWIAFYDGDKGLKKVRAGGGPTQLICASGAGKGGSWGTGGDIIFTTGYNQPLSIVPDIGGTPRVLTDADADAKFDSHRHPCFLPDGRHFLYFARGVGGTNSEIRMASTDGGPEKVIMSTQVAVRYANGHLLYLSEQTLMAQPFDVASGELVGRPAPLAENVLLISGAALGAFSVSDEGSLTYLEGSSAGNFSLWWLDREGQEQAPVGEEALYETVVLSPDGRRAAVTIIDRRAGTNDIWILDIERNLLTRFTNDPADDLYPVWLQDNRTILFDSDRAGNYAVFRKSVGSTTAPELVFKRPVAASLWACAADNRTILYSESSDSTGLDLWSADLTGESEPRRLVASAGQDGAARFSPDGRWVSYWSTASAQSQVYVAPWPEMTPVTQLSTTSGTWHFWTRDMSRIVVQEGEGGLQEIAVSVVDGEFSVGTPQPLFAHSNVKLEGAWLDMSGDGERFLAIKTSDLKVPEFMDLISNWPAMMPDK